MHQYQADGQGENSSRNKQIEEKIPKQQMRTDNLMENAYD
jgi:hypothetical protein